MTWINVSSFGVTIKSVSFTPDMILVHHLGQTAVAGRVLRSRNGHQTPAHELQETELRPMPAKLAAKLYGAAELIAERGIADAKIDEIADAADIPVATLYYYFRGKEEILSFLLSDLLETIAGEVGTAISEPGNAVDRLQRAVEAQVRVMLENPAICRALTGDLGRATRLPELAVALDGAFYRPLEQLLREGAEDGTLRAVAEPDKVALSIFGAITVMGLSGAVSEPEHPKGFIENAARVVCDLLVDGLRAP